MNGPVARRWCKTAPVLLAFLLVAGCRTTRPFGSVNLQEPGWTMQKGQAVWKPNSGAPELVGDLLIARHADGRTLAQFTKIPFPSITAWRSTSAWQIEFQPQNRILAGQGTPAARWLMLYAASAAQGQPLPANLALERTNPANSTWRLWNRQTGETLTANLSP